MRDLPLLIIADSGTICPVMEEESEERCEKKVDLLERIM